jgi:hypothetical protein
LPSPLIFQNRAITKKVFYWDIAFEIRIFTGPVLYFCAFLDIHRGVGQHHEEDEVEAQERRLARISITIVWLFIVCHMWKLIPTGYEAYNSDDGLNVTQWPFSLVVIEYISHSLIVLNSAVNFLIYVFL